MTKLFLLSIVFLSFVCCSANDEDSSISPRYSSSLSTVLDEDSIQKVIGVSSDYEGTSKIDFQDYSEVFKKTLGLSVEQALEGIADGSVQFEKYGETTGVLTFFDKSGLVLAISNHLKVGTKFQVGGILYNSRGRINILFDVSVQEFPKREETTSRKTRSMDAYLPPTLVTILIMHKCSPISQVRLEMRCPANLVLTSSQTSKVITPLFVTEERKLHVEAQACHSSCNKVETEGLKLRVSNNYNYYEEVSCSTGWTYYKGDLPLVFSNGETERINFLYI